MAAYDLRGMALAAYRPQEGVGVAQKSLTIDELYEQQVRARPMRERLRLAQRILAEAADAAPESDERRRSLLELEAWAPSFGARWMRKPT